jgi:hypothetical protein
MLKIVESMEKQKIDVKTENDVQKQVSENGSVREETLNQEMLVPPPEIIITDPVVEDLKGLLMEREVRIKNLCTIECFRCF